MEAMTGESRPSRIRSFFSRRDGAHPRLSVTADFEGGNVSAVEIVSPSHVRFEARADSSPRPLWFYFRIEGAAAPAVQCDLMNADDCLGPRFGWRTVRPVFSTDGRTWGRLPHAQYVVQGTAGYFTFTVPTPDGAASVAYCYPYSNADLNAFLDRLSPVAHYQRTELCRTAGGRPVPLLCFGDERTATCSVWVIARQHSGETPASYTAEGLIEGLISEPEGAQAAIYVAPCLNVDGVALGRYGKDERPVDLNRDWQDEPRRPETAALLQAIRTAHSRHPVELVLDIHSPHHGDMSCYVFGSPPEEGMLYQQESHFIACLGRESPPSVGFTAADVRTDPPPAGSARAYLRETLRTPVLTLEMSYHLAQNGTYLTPEHYRAFGTGAARALRSPLHGAG
jgi:murein tripeptide amidase MpaA